MMAKVENPPRWWKRYEDEIYTVLRKGPGTEIQGLPKHSGRGHQMVYRRRGGEGY